MLPACQPGRNSLQLMISKERILLEFQENPVVGAVMCWTPLQDGDIFHFARLSFDLCWVTPKPNQAEFVHTVSWV